MRYKPYPEYRDSRVEWLGEIPTRWEIKRLRFVCQLNPSKSEILGIPRDTEVSFLPMEKIGEDGTLVLDETRRANQVWQGYTYFRDQDVGVAKITPCFENGKGAIFDGLENGIGFGTTELHILRAREKVHPKFIFYLTRSHLFRNLGTAMMYGAAGQRRVPEDYIKDFATVVPLPDEQRAIAAFLDWETARIDALVARLQRLIELLQEKRAALISHAVTKGLDPTVPMKDSGIEWLGEVPAHWEVVQLRRVVENFVDYRGKTPEKVSAGIPLITAGCIKKGSINFELAQEFIREEDYDNWMVRGLPEIGDVLITTEAPLGESAQIDNPYIALAQRIILLKANKQRLTNDYLKYHFAAASGRGELWSRATGSTAVGIKAYHLRATLITVPPVEEQEVITNLLDHEIVRVNSPVAKVQQLILHLQEYRTALISAAVTGKIDVRDLTPSPGGFAATPSPSPTPAKLARGVGGGSRPE